MDALHGLSPRCRAVLVLAALVRPAHGDETADALDLDDSRVLAFEAEGLGAFAGAVLLWPRTRPRACDERAADGRAGRGPATARARTRDAVPTSAVRADTAAASGGAGLAASCWPA
ncbi:hypothetical protein GCM10020358_24180 [Amorphoplanes nipponensis]|uniref:hypothetical protein n=1 Tax=Actinoplanes nipponensis TaxID=135950 RepID=UPI0031EE3F0C